MRGQKLGVLTPVHRNGSKHGDFSSYILPQTSLLGKGLSKATFISFSVPSVRGLYLRTNRF